MSLLRVENLHVHFPRQGAAPLRAVDGVSLALGHGETLGLVGESGCGKTTLGRAILQLLPPDSGKVFFEGSELTGLGPRALRRERRNMQIVFQDPYSSLNPRKTVFETLAEPLRVHGLTRGRDACARRVRELMESVELASRFVRKYPHEFSGGQRQRIAIARALSLEPRLLIADEPVSALDVSVQAEILNLFERLRCERGLALLFISHDLAVVRHLSDRIAVMYRGRIVEEGPGEALFQEPLHPYTRALLAAIPRPDPDARPWDQREGDQASQAESVSPPERGCAYAPRCPWVQPACREEAPPLESLPREPGRRCACLRNEALNLKGAAARRE